MTVYVATPFFLNNGRILALFVLFLHQFRICLDLYDTELDGKKENKRLTGYGQQKKRGIWGQREMWGATVPHEGNEWDENDIVIWVPHPMSHASKFSYIFLPLVQAFTYLYQSFFEMVLVYKLIFFHQDECHVNFIHVPWASPFLHPPPFLYGTLTLVLVLNTLGLGH